MSGGPGAVQGLGPNGDVCYVTFGSFIDLLRPRLTMVKCKEWLICAVIKLYQQWLVVYVVTRPDAFWICTGASEYLHA